MLCWFNWSLQRCVAKKVPLCGTFDSPLKESARRVWGLKQKKAFNELKKITSQQTSLACPDFNMSFDIHTDASDCQLRAVVSQNNHPIAFHMQKLTDTNHCHHCPFCLWAAKTPSFHHFHHHLCHDLCLLYQFVLIFGIFHVHHLCWLQCSFKLI